ncbi:MAG: glycoside hydrolase family 3 N-terminal domain-containing protein, partial [Brachybacterium sp.]
RHASLTLGPAVVVDLRVRAQHASGARSQQLVEALHERGVHAAEPVYPDHPDQPGRSGQLGQFGQSGYADQPGQSGYADQPGQQGAAAQLLVITRLPRSDPEERQRLAALLARNPEAIVVHTGVPDAAPDHRRLVLAHGGGRTMMRAAVDLMLAGPR